VTVAEYNPCICCGGTSLQCCELKDEYAFPFAPEAGYTLISSEVVNDNTYDCVGEAVLTVKVSKPLVCPGTCTFDEYGDSSCNEISGATNAQILAVMNAFLATVVLPAGWTFRPVTSIAFWYRNACFVEALADADLLACSPGQNAYSTELPIFRKVYSPEVCGDWYDVTLVADTDLLDIQDAMSAAGFVDPGTTIKIGSKLFCLKYDMHAFYAQGMGCYSGDYPDICMSDARAGLVALKFALTCLEEDEYVCDAEPDYPWPSVIPTCSCSALYDPPTPPLVATPACILNFQSNTKAYNPATGLCEHTGIYWGVTKGKVCSVEDPDDDCRCCYSLET
jgi:hypothetical protein